jgi:hypothetical protein
MTNDDLSQKVNDFLALAREDDELVRAEAEVLLDELAPGVVTLIAKVPATLRAEAVIVIADTRHSVGAMVARAILRRVPSGTSKMSEVGRSVVYFAQPRATVDVMLDALGLPMPEMWGDPPEGGAVRLALFLEAGLYATDFQVPSTRRGMVGQA